MAPAGVAAAATAGSVAVPGAAGIEYVPAMRSWRVRIFALTWFTYASYYFCRQPFYITKSSFAQEFGLTDAFLGYIGLTYLLGYEAGQFASAVLGRRLGTRLLLLIGMAATIALNVVFGCVNGGMMILLFMGLNGLAQGTGWSGVIGTMANWYGRKERGQVLGFWCTCYQLGAIGAKSFAALLLGWWGWRYSFFGGAVVTLVVWLIDAFMLRSAPEDVGLQPLADDDEAPPRPTAAPAPAPAERGRRRREPLGWDRKVVAAIIFCGLTYLCVKFLRYSLWSWGPMFLEKTFAVSAATAGQHSWAFDLGGFAGVILAGLVADRLLRGRRSLTALLMILGLVGSCLLMYLVGSSSLWMMTICFVLVGLMLYGPDSLVSATGAIDVGSRRGAVVAAAIINGIGSSGAALEELVIPALRSSSQQQLLPILLLFVGVALLGALAITVLYVMGRKGWSRF